MAGVKELKSAIGIRLKALREIKGWSQAEVARRARVSRDFVGRAERGDREPSLFTLTKFAKIFGVEPGHFLAPTQHDEGPASLRALMELLRSRPEVEIKWVVEVVRDLLNYPVRPDASQASSAPRTSRRSRSPGRRD